MIENMNIKSIDKFLEEFYSAMFICLILANKLLSTYTRDYCIDKPDTPLLAGIPIEYPIHHYSHTYHMLT